MSTLAPQRPLGAALGLCTEGTHAVVIRQP